MRDAIRGTADRMTDSLNRQTLDRLRTPIRVTLAGLWAERLTRAFWPLWSVLFLTLAALGFNLHETAPVEAAWLGLLAAVAGAGWAAVAGLRAFRKPTAYDALLRLDATLPGRPLATLSDTQAIGAADPASAAVWAAHRARMAARAATAKPVAPDLRLSRRDPFGLRYLALTAVVMAALFGSFWRAATVTGLVPGSAEALVAGPSWEGWVQPPPYTGKPVLYLNDIASDEFSVPTGSRVQIRLYGDVGALTVSETVSGRAGTEVPPASEAAQDFDLRQSGQIVIDGPRGRTWSVIALSDAAPTIAPTGAVTREKDGRLRLPFAAEDDFGVTGGQATITLDLAAIPRRYGLVVDPEPREALILDLPMPIRGDRAKFEEALVDDISEHPFANLAVKVRLTATDAIGQTGQSETLSMILPGKRFFDPLAAAIIELRRDLLWNRTNAPRAAQIMRAITNEPEGLIRNEKAWLQLRVLIRQLYAEAPTLTAERRDEIAAALWDIALMIEEGDLASAMERLKRAQDRLDEAIRNGADPAEIQELMQEFNQAMREYMEELAEQAQRDPDTQRAEDYEGMTVTGDQIQEMMKELQKLMEEGRMAEAAELMEMMRQMMENMEMVQGQGGGGQGNPTMRDLAETLRDQQGLSDDAFRELQEGEGQQGEGQQGQDQQGDGQGQGSLSDRQRALRDRLGQLNEGELPGDGSETGEEGRRRLEDAGRAMDEAERALRDGDLPGALDRQAEAMEAMREGIRRFGEAMAEEQQRQNGTAQGRAEGNDPNAQRDPLGRDRNEGPALGSDRNALQGGEDVYRRAEELLGEIRRRQGDQSRPNAERDYLQRLLDLF